MPQLDVVGLVNALAWPATALLILVIVLPFIKEKSSELTSAIISARTLLDRLPEIQELLSSMKELKSITEYSRLQLEQSNNAIKIDIAALEDKVGLLYRQKEISEQTPEELEKSLAGGEISPSPALEAKAAGFKRINSAWSDVKSTLVETFARLSMDPPDLRSVAYEISRLADKRRRKPLSTDTVELATELQAIWKNLLRSKAIPSGDVEDGFIEKASMVQQKLREI